MQDMAEPRLQLQGVLAPNPLPLPADPPEPQPAQHVLHLNWSHFKPEFSGRKPEEDADAHLLCTNDWMNAHLFVEGVKVQRFY